MIEKFYASHIKTSLDAEAINRRRHRKPKAKPTAADEAGAGEAD